MINILWADDEIDLLKPHVLFLEEKGYHVETVNNGDDALEKVRQNHFDIVFLDEQMPGISGIETLMKVKQTHPSLPVVMITKSEEENIMDDAIGSKISDYLIKPVNPRQILLSIKKNLDSKRLMSEKTTSQYQQEFRNIGMTLGDNLSTDEWIDIYKKIVYWEIELEESKDEGMFEILKTQKQEANNLFARFVESNYTDWLNGNSNDSPLLSHQLFKEKVANEISGSKPLFMILIDNLRYDQWMMLRPIFREFFRIEKEELYYSILPTATQYSRNAIFAGLLPSEIEKMFPNLWLNDEDEGGKNLHEDKFLENQLKRLGKNIKHSYHKITNLNNGKKLADNIPNLMSNQLNVIVYNFVDMLSHARTDMEVIRELADDEAAYRSLTISWFEHSPLFDIFRQIAEKKCRVIVTTDHGTIRVTAPSKVIGDRNTNTNLRYKQGKNLSYVKKEVFEVRNPTDAFLPKQHVSSAFIFAKEDMFFAYPNNYNYYVNYYRNTFQHGGVSLEEMLIPVVSLVGK
ncbi:MAG: two-component system response regulator [Flavobacteriales bacterium]|nr:MAG: two-component system response regulator [Flavobacteriales bacterium]